MRKATKPRRQSAPAHRIKVSADLVKASGGSTPTKITLGLLQHACGTDPDANLDKALSLAEQAAKKGANIICTQELFRSQYFCQAENHEFFKLAEPVPEGPS